MEEWAGPWPGVMRARIQPRLRQYSHGMLKKARGLLLYQASALHQLLASLASLDRYDDSEWQVLLFLIRDGEGIVKKFALHKLQIIQQRGGIVGIPTQISPQSPHSSHTCSSCDKE